MGNIFAYSGITAKTKAMTGKLFSDDDFRRLAEFSSVTEAVSFLKEHVAYHDIFYQLEENSIHRGKIEKLLQLSKYRDYYKLYQFANQSQRRFLDLYFIQYEIIILKYCLRTIFDHRNFDLDLSMFREFFERHSKIDLMAISSSENIGELISHLKGTEYYEPLIQLDGMEHPALFDYDLVLDLYHFKTIWQKKNRYLSKQDLALITRTFGSKLDLLNLQWIYRSKKYYRFSTESIAAMMIPIHYHLKEEEIKALIEIENLDGFQAILNETYYAKTFDQKSLQKEGLEQFYYAYLGSLHRKSSRQNPYSVATLNTYLYSKEQEVRKLTTIIEGIRYGLDPQKIVNYAMLDTSEVNVT